MPRYTNSTNSVISIGSVRVEPNSFKDSNEYFAALPAGLAVTAPLPVFTKTLQSVKLSGTGTTTIAATATGNYMVSIFVPAGTNELTFKINDASDVARLIGPGDSYQIQCSYRVVNSVIVTAITGVAYLSVDAI